MTSSMYCDSSPQRAGHPAHMMRYATVLREPASITRSRGEVLQIKQVNVFDSSHIKPYAMAPAKSGKATGRRARTFGGCGTCRRRHVKCDEVRPVCLTCKATGAECEGFSAEIRWMSSDGSHSGYTVSEAAEKQAHSTRRHLYSGKHVR